MLATQLAQLLDDPRPAVADALEVVVGFDTGLVHGLGRLGEERTAGLAALAGAVAGSPLGTRAAEAVDKVAAGSIADDHLAALAGARAALLGAVHDALVSDLDAALNRSRAAWPAEAAPGSPVPGTENLLGGCRSWLHELAIAGWRGVDHDLVSAADQTVEALLAEPRLRRLAVLLDGLVAELRASCPVATMERVPVRRWADLWTRALLLAQPTARHGGVEAAERVSGRLLILGVDVHEHGTALQLQVHGVLEPSGGAGPLLVRTGVVTGKVDTIVGPALWRLPRGCPVLLGALAEQRVLEVTELPLLPSGDLIWQDDHARAGEVVDPFAVARVQLAGATAPAVPPLDRHPVRIAEPVLLEGYTATAADDGTVTLELAGHALPVDLDRLPACGPLTAEHVVKASACLGLLRWDGGRWLVQPLAVQIATKRKTAVMHNGEWAAGVKGARAGKAGDAVAVLRERAGRLLRR